MKQEYNTSAALLDEAQKYIPALTQTFSKGPQTYGYDEVPHFLQSAYGSKTIDVDGNSYIDFSMGLGTVLLGHANEVIVRAVCDQSTIGNSLSMMHPLEIDVAKKILAFNTWADMVRFGKNGSDCTTAAVRIARAMTGKNKIAIATGYGDETEAYHGWHDWSACLGNMRNGIPDEIAALTVTFEYNSIESLITLLENDKHIAAVIMETTKFTPPNAEFVQVINTLFSDYGVLLIIDDIINGLRIHSGGSPDKFGIQPDLCIYGKALSNGFPLSAIVGRAPIMSLFDDLLFTLSYGGELIALRAASALLSLYYEKCVFNTIERNGLKLMAGLNQIIDSLNLSDRIVITGYPARFKFTIIDGYTSIRTEWRKKLIRNLFSNGVLTAGVHNLSWAHTETDIVDTLLAYETALKQTFLS